MNFRSLGLAPAQLAKIQSLIAETPELNELLGSSEETPTDRALRYVSLVRHFDESLYTDVFLKYDEGLPAFDDLIQNADVEPVPRTEDTYWLRNTAQTRWRAAWEDFRDDEKIWCQRLHDWLAANGGNPTTLFDLLLTAKPSAALALLQREYNRADTGDDLVFCNVLVQQTEAYLEKSPDTSDKRAFQEFVTRYRSRAMFLTELHKTAKFVKRPLIDDAFKDLLAAKEDKWILFLDAPGGMGKTTFIQHLISHQLLKSPPFPLVVRVDLDEVNVSSLAAAPWLLALSIASDLDQQLPQKLFSSAFLSQVEAFKPLLFRRTSDRARSLSDEEIEQLRVRARNESFWWSKFQSLCAELPPERPLLIFIDTLEEASLHVPDKFRKVLENLEDLHLDFQNKPAPAHQLRLVLSGRNRPDATHFKEYDQKLKNQTNFVTLGPLKEHEAKDLIAQLLPKPRAADVVDALVSVAAGNPFKISILCDILADHPDMTAAELKECKDADVAYLIQRVITRIPAHEELGLRWLLRYGSVPRRLTYSFVENTLQPLLIRALRGELEAEKEDIPASPLERKAWLQRADVDLKTENLWKKLTKYSSEHGWISVDSKDPNTVTLHSEVVKPMRRLLKDQVALGSTIYTKLNEEAAKHFTGLKAEHRDRWVDYTLGELFHKIEAKDEKQDPLKIVQDAFAERPAHADAKLRLELATEIIKTEGDFSDAPPAVRAWANWEAADAVAIAGNFRYLPSDDRRVELNRYLTQACDLARGTRMKLPGIIWRWREFLDANYPDMRTAVFGILACRSEDRIRYWLLLLDLFGQERLESRVVFILRLLIAFLSGSIRSARIPRWVWRERYAASLIQLGSYDTAISMLRDILSLHSDLNDYDVDRIRSRTIKAQVRALRLEDAERQLERFPVGKTLAHEKAVFTAEIHLMRRDAWAALKCADSLADSGNYRGPLIRAMAYGQLLRVAEASSAFAEALIAASALGQEHIDRVQLEEIRFRLFEARLPLELLTPRSVDTGGAAAQTNAEFQLCRAYQQRSTPTAAAASVLALTTESYSRLIRARTMLAAFSWGFLPETSIEKMQAVLGGVETYNARLYLTNPPVDFSKVLPVEKWKMSLDNLMTPVSDETGARLAYLYGGRFLRAIGKERKAESMLSRCKVSDPPKREQLALLRQFRLGGNIVDDPAMWDGLRDDPGLYFAALVENAERAEKANQLDIARASLDRIPGPGELDQLLPDFGKRRLALQERLTPTMAMSHGDVASTSQASAAPRNFLCLAMDCEGERLFIEQPDQTRPTFVSTVESDALKTLTYSRERTPRRLIGQLVKNLRGTTEELSIPFLESGLSSSEAPASGATILLTLRTPQLVAAPWEFAFRQMNLCAVRTNMSVHDASQVAMLFRKALNPLPRNPSMIGFERLKSGPTDADIITIFSPMSLDPHRDPSLASGETAESVSRLIATSKLRRPFVILHAATESAASDAFEQLLVRNQFAQGLINGGAVSGVLATSGMDGVFEAVSGAGCLFDIPNRLALARPWVSREPTIEAYLKAEAAMFVAADMPPAV